MLEAIIASGIIATAVASALTLTTSSISAEKDSETLLVAGNFAREGIEAVRSLRDSNWLAGVAWDDGLHSGSDYSGIPVFAPAANTWSINFAPTAVTDATTRLYRYTTGSGNAVVGLFVQGTSQPPNTTGTLFNRIVILDALCDDGAGSYVIRTSGTDCGGQEKIGIRVTSRVRWATAGRTKNVDMEERMFNWR